MLECKKIGKGRARTIRFRLILLVALIACPLMGLVASIALSLASAKREVVELERADVTHRVSSSIDREISTLLGKLYAVANSQALAGRKWSSFEEEAARLVSEPLLSVRAFDQFGAVLAKASMPDAAPARGSVDTDLARKVFSGAAVVSSVRGEGLANAIVTLAVPARISEKISVGIAADLRIGFLSRIFEDEKLELGWAGAVVDRDGRFVARSLDAGRRLGKPARPELQAASLSSRTYGTFENTTYEGLDALNFFQRSPLTGWTTVIAAPAEELTGPLRRMMLLLLAGGVAICAATLAVTLELAQRIAEPVRNLSQYANALASGASYSYPEHQIVELDEVRAALDRAMAQSARLAAIVASSEDAIVSMTLDGRVETWNRGAEDLFGYSEAEMLGKRKTLIIPDGDIEEFEKHRTAILEGHSVRAETRRQRKDGSIVHVSLTAAPIRIPDGRIIAISSILHDISERKSAEEHREFLMRELAHRSKNQLAIVQSIASQTARHSGSSIDAFVASFRQRLQGVSASHDLLASHHWRTVRLSDLVGHQLRVFVAWPTDSITVEGPDVSLSPASAEAIGLALHELGTNSLKYGALSVPKGRVAITWSTSSHGSGPRELRLAWQETGGPPVDTPSLRGFGTKVLERLVAQSVNGEARIEYRPEGLYWSLVCPMDAHVSRELSLVE